MSKHQNDSFLPSGAIDSPRKMTSPLNVPRTMPEASYIPSPHASNGTSPSPQTYNRSPQHPNGPPMSPPKTRSASAEETSAELVEDWRKYTNKLRSQFEGEKAHLIADQAYKKEVQDEERALWDKERASFKARIAELERKLEERNGSGSGSFVPQSLNHKQSASYMRAQQAMNVTSPGSNSVSGSVDGSRHAVAQESGRNADGTPFYAPAPQNPSRTFDPAETSEMRVDDITAPRESLGAHDLETIPETPTETIDISLIRPDLEGVSIKASAVSPTFVATVLSPAFSPPKLSPNTKPPPRDTAKTLEVVRSPEDRRLTMHAGHTPNHSISKFEFLGGSGSASGGKTPTQDEHTEDKQLDGTIETDAVSVIDEDPELTGQLSLPNVATTADPFVAALFEKLNEAKKSEGNSPSAESEASVSARSEKDDGPTLRIKSSMNFGRPLGSM
ncbi:hypothetical protein LSUE1_G010038 [Lachnellula suecica]|uniref:Uncharacterized protein n=1 Tax=Lachnellula suecica TaxID=602035 RepID=A0A8T9BUL7_9HELO|nr:hypothetical protein LSUE1_G010038 [Lachnellula suecica]